MKRKILGWCLLLIPVVCLVLELLPSGTAVVYAHTLADGTVERLRELYSYFHTLLHGRGFASGSFGPVFVPGFTILLLLFALRYFFTGRGRAGVVAERGWHFGSSEDSGPSCLSQGRDEKWFIRIGCL